MVSPRRLASHLRLGTCDDPDLLDDLKYYLRVATACAEHALDISLGVTVRTMTLKKLPGCGEPLSLPCLPVWDWKQWRDWTESLFQVDADGCIVQGADGKPVAKDCAIKSELELWRQISNCFNCAAPVEVIIDGAGCDCSPTKLVCGIDFEVNNCRRPNRLELLDSDQCGDGCGKCKWPCLCCGCDRDRITVRYLCGDFMRCSLLDYDEVLHHRIVMNAGILYEVPETGGLGNKLEDVEKWLDRFSRKLKWRL